ncbi:MAG TPA: rRNA adenine N-6-methyltransferase family protein [Candidatus Thermoplasmatota archaeon]|nr:rRNA adenine N-6-methyltransferase family protein [Candidatus Thermoplasmatota archaeon]
MSFSRELRERAAYARDLARLLRFGMENPTPYTKWLILDRLRRRTGARVMVETGTYEGRTTARAARRFERVYTVELDPTLAQRAKEHLARYPNVTVLQGDAMQRLPEILQRSDVRDALVFLDAHYSGGETAHGDLAEPAVEELVILHRHVDKLRAIVVDDFRCFGVNAGFPSKGEVVRQAEALFGKDFDLSVTNDQLVLTRKR